MPHPLLVHVGYHKTATTWLQKCLFSREDLGYVSPWGAQAGSAVDVFVLGNPFQYDPTAGRRAFVEGMAEAAQRQLVPVISNEAMCGSEKPRQRYERQVADRLFETLPNAKILITIREQKAIILSHYREEISRGSIATISAYLHNHSTKPGFSAPCQLDHFEYDLFAEYYIERFGADSVLVLPQEELRRNTQGFCDKLADFVGLPRKPAPDSESARVGLRGWSLSYKRWCNYFRLGVRNSGRARPTLSYRAVNKVASLINHLTPEAWILEFEARLKDEVKSEVGTYFAASNGRLQQLTGLDLKSLGYDLPEEG